MDELSQKKFDEIIKKEPHELNRNNIAFLRARRSYLSGELKDKFNSVLGEKKEKKEEIKKTKKSKKK